MVIIGSNKKINHIFNTSNTYISIDKFKRQNKPIFEILMTWRRIRNEILYYTQTGSVPSTEQILMKREK